jgi:hypothetical protein
MNTLKSLYREFRFFIRSQRLRYLPYHKIFFIWVKNRKLNYKIIALDEAKEHKKSDTIFILGSGPSIKELTKEQWQHISKHDSFGINFSFLLDFVPTFHSMEDGQTKWMRGFIEERISPYRKKFSNTVWFISNRHLSRFIHPRLTPEFFPENPICCVYKFPKSIELSEDRPFIREDFTKNSIIYRGSLSVVLYLADLIGYKNIVLLGIDLHTPEHFFYDMPEMEEYVKIQKAIHDKDKFQYMIPKPNKSRPFDEYLYALINFYFKPQNINLYIGHKENLLSEGLRLYPWSENKSL